MPSSAGMSNTDQGRAPDPTDPYDPPDLPASRSALPTFDDIPEVLRRVLVVDDNAVFRAFLRGLLQGRPPTPKLLLRGVAAGYPRHDGGELAGGVVELGTDRVWLVHEADSTAAAWCRVQT